MQDWNCSWHFPFSLLHWYLQLLLNILVQKMQFWFCLLLVGVQRSSKESPDCEWIIKDVVPQLYLLVESFTGSFEP